MSKRIIAVLVVVLSCAAHLVTPQPASAADAVSTPTERFYGKITGIDMARQMVTVRNGKQKLDADFRWNQGTALTANKKPIPASELQVGQSLIVSYIMENNTNVAKKITVRPLPSKKKAAQ